METFGYCISVFLLNSSMLKYWPSSLFKLQRSAICFILGNSIFLISFNRYRISSYSFRGNYSFLNLTLCTVTFCYSTYRCGIYSCGDKSYPCLVGIGLIVVIVVFFCLIVNACHILSLDFCHSGIVMSHNNSHCVYLIPNTENTSHFYWRCFWFVWLLTVSSSSKHIWGAAEGFFGE